LSIWVTIKEKKNTTLLVGKSVLLKKNPILPQFLKLYAVLLKNKGSADEVGKVGVLPTSY
jgi:hypothetical protein